MKFIPETIIDDIANQIGDSEALAAAVLEEMNAQQPALLPFVLGENEEAFAQAERDFMVYLLLVLWKSCVTVQGSCPPIAPDTLSEAEEQNWQLLEAVKAKRFRDRLDVFFENSIQEDLLAFLEDVLTEDEEDPENQVVTREGREPMFILLKSVVDCLDRVGK